MKTKSNLVLTLVIVLTILFGAAHAARAIDTSKLKDLKPRSIGPAAMSGRVTAIAVDPLDSQIIYAGTASGGLWKSNSAGLIWTPIFDDQDTASIGAIAIDPHNPDVIWVGTGEGNPRNSQSVGLGVYKSLDGGRTWKKKGLEKTEQIHRVLINPLDTDIVYVAAVGPTWSDSEERGVFKTKDGGATWHKVLYVDERTGVGDLVMDPRNPDKLIAAMWEHRRWPWFFKSGGPGSGLHVTFDGGTTWEKRTNKDGLPKGELGRMGLGIAKTRPEIVYALIESKKNALYRSDDGGFKWQMINDKPEIGNRPFYYFDIRVDPHDENRIYSLHSSVTLSEDGGKSFIDLITFHDAHSDHHAFWIDPRNPQFLIDGNDGGMAISRDRGKNWRFVENLPVGQFYHVNVDMEVPYNVYGGLQDNGSYMGPSEVWEGGGFLGGGDILNSHWQMVSFGDGFDVIPDPSDNRYGYSMSQGGNLYRFDKVLRSTQFIRPPDPESVRLRFNWNAGIAVDPFNPKTVYYGSQFVHRSNDRGNTWEIISGDLTTNDPEKQKQLDSGGLTFDVTNAENNTTIVAIAPSPVKKGVIWAGTDDGKVQLTRNGGQEWSDVTSHIPGIPQGIWVPHIEASKFREAEAFVVLEDHRRGNWTPFVFKTMDFGATWDSLITENIRGFAYVIEQDPVVENLLFMGTEFHLYFSIDGGQSWTQWDQGYPTVPTMDLVVHPRDPDLVIGTFGRSIYIMDDITALREIASGGSEILDKPLHLFEITPAIQVVLGSPAGELTPGNGVFRGKNPPRGALINYVINAPVEEENADPVDEDDVEVEKGETGKKSEEDEVKIEVLHGEEVIQTLKGPVEPGLHRVVWKLDRKGEKLPVQGPMAEFGPGASLPVLPGEYTVRVSYKELSASQPVLVRLDPRLQVSEMDLKARAAFVDDFQSQIKRVSQAVEKLKKANSQIDQVDKLAAASKGEKGEELRAISRKTRDALEALDALFFSKPAQGIRMDPEVLTLKMMMATQYMNSGYGPPTATERSVVENVRKAVDAATGQVDAFFKEGWEKYKEAVKAARLSLVD